MRAFTPEEAYQAVQEKDAVILDLRTAVEFGPSHPEGAVQVQYSRRGLDERVATAIPEEVPIIAAASDEMVAEFAAEDLAEAGRNRVLGYLAASVSEWEAAGLPTATLKQIDIETLRERLRQRNDDAIILDVRESFELEWGTIAGATPLHWSEIWHRTEELPRDREILVVCGDDRRSCTAASILLHHGWENVTHVLEGMAEWVLADYPVEKAA